jgi:hypothetical protein
MGVARPRARSALQTSRPSSSRHHQVQDQQVAGALGLGGQRGAAVGHGRDRITRLLQVQHDEVADVGLVFGNEDVAGHGRGRRGARRSYTDVIGCDLW